VLVQAGLDLTAYRQNPIVLFQHQQDCPVGTARALGLDGEKLLAKVEFAPIGASSEADKVRALVKSGVLKGVSIGFATGGALFARLGAMPLLERLLILIAAVLLVAALALLTGHDIGRNAVGPKPQVSAAGAGRFWWQ
jgi:hypothetical protein